MPEFRSRFSKYHADTWLCFPLNYLIPMKGVASSTISYLEAIQVLKCNNYTSGNKCAPQAEIDALFTTYGSFHLSFNYINAVINPN